MIDHICCLHFPLWRERGSEGGREGPEREREGGRKGGRERGRERGEKLNRGRRKGNRNFCSRNEVTNLDKLSLSGFLFSAER